MERSSVLWDPFCSAYLSWHDIETITMREREPNPRLYGARNGLLNIDAIPDRTFRRQFRSENQDLPVLEKALQVPDYVTSAQGVRVSVQEALCMCLQRLVYPNRLCDLQDFFGRHYRLFAAFPHAVAVFTSNNHTSFKCLSAKRTQFDPATGTATYVWHLKAHSGHKRKDVAFNLAPGDTPDTSVYYLNDAEGLAAPIGKREKYLVRLPSQAGRERSRDDERSRHEDAAAEILIM
ncbi:hypothetical protein HPB49_013390 [Dermacentor silvarum]|uniref:Uncharacterized protein n=1 Tax=Dermacentor silvarum TaxID=543639 RepID=A0ACB8CFE4_DERSI|nr:hypothetical protein HPB49_013390 [Dermacentor silvarum]